MDILPDDKDFERFFREGTDDHEFGHDAEAWKKMEALLDNDKRKSTIILWSSIGLLILLLTAGAWYGYSKYLSTGWETIPDSQEVIVANKQRVNVSNGDQEYSATGTIGSEDLLSTNRERANSDESLVQTSELGTSQSVHRKDYKFMTGRIEGSLNNLKKKEDLEIGSNNKSFNSTSTTLDASISYSLADESVVDAALKASQPKENLNWVLVPSIVLSSLNSKMVIPSLKLKYNGDPEKLKIINRGLYFGIALGAESSATKNRGYSQTDIALGLNAGYLLSDKLGLSLSSTYIQDHYIADGKDYNAPSGFWKSSAPVQAVSKTDVIEIGAGIHFFSHGILGNGINASVSSISNIMLNEQYTYNFQNTVDDFQSSWTMANNTFFNSIEFAVGYQRSLGEKYALSIEPYLKIPISGVGHGRMKLSTIGLRLRVNLKP